MRAALIANTDWYLYGYRMDLAQKLSNTGFSITFISPPGRYTQYLCAHGFDWKPIRLSRKGINPFYEFIALIKLAKLYREEKYDVVHHFTIKVVIYGSIAAKLSKTKRVINSITGLGYLFVSDSSFTRIIRQIVLFLFSWALRNTTVIFQNKDDLEYFLSKKLISDKQCVVIKGSGVDMNKFQYSSEPKGLPTVVMVSRLLWEKGVGEFVEAAEIVNKSRKKARFVLVGNPDPGNPNSIPRNKILSWIKKDIVEWNGWREDMPKVYQDANIVCFPSYYGEGLPKVLIEAAASGRAIVTTNVAGCRDVVQDGLNGFLVPKKDVDELVRALTKLIRNSKLRKKMGLAGRDIVSKYFSVDSINRKTLSLYKGVV